MPNNEDTDISKNLKEKLLDLIDTIVLPNMSIYHKIALFLFPPANKLVLFDENEKMCIKEECKNIMKSYLNDISNQQGQTESSTSVSAYNSQIFMDFLQPQQLTINLEEKVNNEIRIYEGTNVTFHDDFDILQWWHLHQTQFPLFFSRARLLISEKRSLIGSNPVNVNQLMFLHSNVKENDIIKELEQETYF
ncbi:PREDICTED: uncharacterized protein LOC108365768 [Rhagoletis zephyria]|uniref:uncharacterized protein LOC108365768 n=1 Tax=Rhagoletis zephyria TaxID=28612 RepID=UPI0008117EAF|nr:PREDICTED: uncharacterized protein LOC108365768 [Rhagoletis zephyria]